MALDKYADRVFIAGLKRTRLARYMLPKNNTRLLPLMTQKIISGLSFDPLDGSSLIDVNFCTGSIIGIYPGNVLERGTKMVAAMYFLYGPLTSLTLTTGKGVHEFVLDENGDFFLKHRDIKIPEGRFMHLEQKKKSITSHMPSGLSISSMKGINFASVVVLSPTFTRYSIRAGYLRIQHLKERKKEN